MGLGTAFHLAERGYDVTVLEKGESVANVCTISTLENVSKNLAIIKYKFSHSLNPNIDLFIYRYS